MLIAWRAKQEHWVEVAAAFSRGGVRSSLHKRLDVYLPRRQVYSGETPNLPRVDPVILLSRGGETHVRSEVQHRFIRSQRCTALNAHGDAMAVFGFNCGSAVEVSASIGTQLEVAPCLCTRSPRHVAATRAYIRDF